LAIVRAGSCRIRDRIAPGHPANLCARRPIRRVVVVAAAKPSLQDVPNLKIMSDEHPRMAHTGSLTSMSSRLQRTASSSCLHIVFPRRTSTTFVSSRRYLDVDFCDLPSRGGIPTKGHALPPPGPLWFLFLGGWLTLGGTVKEEEQVTRSRSLRSETPHFIHIY